MVSSAGFPADCLQTVLSLEKQFCAALFGCSFPANDHSTVWGIETCDPPCAAVGMPCWWV